MDLTKKITQGKGSRSDASAFIKRRACLMKKASELTFLCDSKVAVIGYSNDGKLFEYASSDFLNADDDELGEYESFCISRAYPFTVGAS